MDAYYKKTIEFAYHKNTYKFDVANTIFSTFDIDLGTQLLLRSVKLEENKTLLDLGCGYGALGIILSTMYKTSKTTMVDKDLLSIKYAQANVAQNKLENIELIGSVGLETVPMFEYDYIFSNIPAKIGDQAIEEEFILKPLTYLRKDGNYYFVIMSALNRLIPMLGTKHNLKLTQIVKKNRYVVYKLTH